MTTALAPPVEAPALRDDPPAATEPRWSRALGIGIVGVLIVAFVASGWWRFTAPFGDNHDGSNGGFWVDIARDITEHGPFASHLGSRLFTGGTYAHHPPLIAWVTSVGDVVGRDNTFVYRLPLILGSLATIALLVSMLRYLGIRWLATGAGVALALGTPLFFVYGPMIDTLPLSLPFGMALLFLWHRRYQGASAPGWLLGLLAALCVLSSWEAALLVGVACFASMLLARRDTSMLRQQTPLFVGAGIGLALLAAWLFWATGSLGPLVDQLRSRSGTGVEKLGFVDSFEKQWTNLDSVLGVIRWLLLPAAIAGLANRKTRLVMLVLVSTAVLYPVVLREAAQHDYWNFWFVAPLAIGLAAAIDWIAERARSVPARVVLAGAVCTVVVASIGFTVFDDPWPSRHFRIGLGATHALEAVRPHSPELYTVLPRGYNDNWIALRNGVRVHSVLKPADMITALYSHPAIPVLLDCDQVLPQLARLCRKRSPDQHGEVASAYAVVPLSWINDPK